MRSLSRIFVVAVALLAIGLGSSSVRANDAFAGKFTLLQPTQWNNTMLPAGNYTFQLNHNRVQNVDLLAVQGANHKFNLFVFGDWACQTCQRGSLSIAVQGDHYAVTSMNVAGFHVNFKVRPPAGARGEEAVKTPKATEQVAVHVDQN